MEPVAHFSSEQDHPDWDALYGFPPGVPFRLKKTHHLLALGLEDNRPQSHFFVENNGDHFAALNLLQVRRDHNTTVTLPECEEWLEPGEARRYQITVSKNNVLVWTKSGRRVSITSKPVYRSLQFKLGLTEAHLTGTAKDYAPLPSFANVHVAVYLPRGSSPRCKLNFSVVSEHQGTVPKSEPTEREGL
jgi:hypothetical protein